MLSVAHVDEALAGVQAGDVVLTQLESPLDAVAAALEGARAAGALAMLNPAPANVVVDRRMLERADVMTPNETEFVAMLGRHVGERLDADSVSGIDQQRLHALCRELSQDGTVVVTLGASGCFVSHADNERRGDASACYRVSAEAANVVAPAMPSTVHWRHHWQRARRWPSSNTYASPAATPRAPPSKPVRHCRCRIWMWRRQTPMRVERTHRGKPRPWDPTQFGRSSGD